jgi:hypothetical protein
MPVRNYRIAGRVIDRASRAGVAQLTVEAWDRDTRYHDMLGSAVTAADGSFSIAFDSEYFGDFAPDRAPDLFFKILRDGKVLKSTLGEPLMNVPPGVTQVTLEIGAGAEMPAPGRDRIRSHHVRKVSDFAHQSDFKGVFREQRDKASMLGRFLAAAGGSALAAFELEPLRPSRVPTAQVVGQDTASAMANLAASRVQVSEVKTYDPKTDAASVRALAEFPLRLKPGDQVTLYEEQGTVRYYSVVKPVAPSGVDAETVARLDREVKDLKGEQIAQLKAELARMQQSAADKDAQIERLQNDLAKTQAEQAALDQRFPAEKLAALERQMQLLNERVRTTPAPTPPPAPPVVRTARPKPKRGKGD